MYIYKVKSRVINDIHKAEEKLNFENSHINFNVL